MGEHTVYGCPELTIYAEIEKDSTPWNAFWNSSYRPVVWGCTLSNDRTYVVSFIKGKDSFTNVNGFNTLSDPYRTGYDFLGWSTTQDGLVEYTTAELASAPDGIIYAVWGEKTSE